jgi:hypothetical protein
MLMHVTYEVLEPIYNRADVSAVRARAEEMIKLAAADKRVIANAWFVGQRGGFCVMEVDNPAQVMEVVGPLIDMFKLNVTACAPWSVVTDMFARDRAEGRFD